MRIISRVENYVKADVRPSELIEKYVSLMKADIATYFLPSLASITVCPACDSESIAPSFERLGMMYHHCNDCNSLFVGARPTSEALRQFGENSQALKFWSEELARGTSIERSKRIIQPRMNWLAQGVAEYNAGTKSLVTLGHQPGYGEALKDLNLFSERKLVTLDRFDGHAENNFSTVIDGLDKIADGDIDVALAFESIDATLSPKDIISELHRVLNKDGLLFITSILGSGFDIQTLKGKHDSILPADRMNLLSVEGWEALLSQAGFEIIEFSTPGIFDVEIVNEALKNGNFNLDDSFLSYMFEKRNQHDLHAFQTFLQQSLLSSYGRILAKKL